MCDTVTILRDGVMVASKPMKDLTLSEIEQLMVGKTMLHERNIVEKTSNEKVLEVANLSKRNNFADISFSLDKGEVLGIIGLLGSGRTELATALFGISTADSGSIEVDGEQVTYPKRCRCSCQRYCLCSRRPTDSRAGDGQVN
ncbi:MAG: ATP-binding cassette domain-containing protein [Sphaerochaetaceae bacterium]